jgi:cell division protein FtsA
MKHITQLTEFITGMDTRIGYPNEHLAPGLPEEMASPMYATGIGLVIIGLKRVEKDAQKVEKPVVKAKKPPRGSFFDAIKNFFDEEGVN